MPKKKTIKAELTEGAVEDAQVYAEVTQQEVIKLLHVVSVIRTPKTLIGQMALQVKAGLYALTIDEPTVRAMAKVFDDFRAEHPDGKAPPAPPLPDPLNNEVHPAS